MTPKATKSPRQSPAPERRPDLAAEHARVLLRACGHPLQIADRDDPSSAPLEWALSGAMALTGPSEGPPRFAAGALASAACGAGMALRAMAPRSALAGLDASALLAERAAIAELHGQGDVSAGGSARLFATRTDHVAVNLPRDEDWQLAPAWLEAKDESAFSTARDWKNLARQIADKETKELVERARLMGLAVAPARRSIPRDRPPFTIQHESERSPTPPQRPIRLLDLTNLWAGPLATSLLAMAGIQVLKIESPTRPDGARRGPDAFFQLLNGNKQGCALDLHRSHDRGIFECLLEGADIVVENARPRALSQLGFDAPSWVTGARGRLWASITGYGRSQEWIAFGDDAAVAASPDPDESNPTFCADAIADPLAGLTLAALLLAHTRSGRGGLLDLSLADCTAHAASLPDDGLVLPLATGPQGWSVVEAGRVWKIAEPRARSLGGPAPPLAAAEENLLTEWTTTC